MTHDEALGLLASLAVMFYDKTGDAECRAFGAASDERVDWAKEWSTKFLTDQSPLHMSVRDNIFTGAIDLAMSVNPIPKETAQ